MASPLPPERLARLQRRRVRKSLVRGFPGMTGDEVLCADRRRATKLRSAVQVGVEQVFQVLLLAAAGRGLAEFGEDEVFELLEADLAALDVAA